MSLGEPDWPDRPTSIGRTGPVGSRSLTTKLYSCKRTAWIAACWPSKRTRAAIKGTLPTFSGVAPPGEAELLYEAFCDALRGLGVPVEPGAFGARMAVSLVNDGPVTIVLEP